jgi:pseudouridine synthase
MTENNKDTAGIRLNKYIAQQGFASRRGADKLIEEGAVKINGKPAAMGQQFFPENDTLEIDQKTLEKKEEEKRYFALHKPRGYVCSTKKTEVEDQSIMDLFPPENSGFPRIYPVGRLDKDSSGLLLLTNDGDFAYQLTHPKFEHSKLYVVEIWNKITDEMLERLKQPFVMLGSKTRKAGIEKIGMYQLKITLKEGKNHQIRRMIRSVGSGVKTLKRVKIEDYELPENLPIGEYTELSKSDIKKYFSRVDL